MALTFNNPLDVLGPTTSMYRLQSTPPDVVLEIMYQCRVKDIFSLRKTCVKLWEISQERNLWIKALYDTCCRNEIPRSSFAVSQMSLSELEKAAFAPTRILQHLWNHQNTSNGLELQPYYTRRISGNEDGYKFRSVFIVPGGRFCVTVVSTAIHIWDLSSSSMSEKPQRVKTWYIEESDLLTVSSNPDSDGIRIAVENEGANTARHISVFEYHPSSGRSNEWIWNHFHETENVVVDLITMSCNYLLIATSAHVCIWDFVNDKEAMWTYDRLGIKSRTLSNVMLDTEENVVILFTFNRVICWKILPLGMKEAGISSVCHHDKMELVFDINFEKPRFPGRTPLATDFKRVADWYKITPSSRIFDIRLNFRSRSDTRKWIWTGYQVVDTPVPGPQSETNSSGTHTNLQSIYKVVRLEHWSTHTESQGVLSSIENIDDDDDSDGDDNDNEGEGDSVHQYGSYVDVTRFGLEGDEERYNSGDDGNRPTILDGGEEYGDAIENEDEVQPDTENDDRYYSSGSEDFFFEFGEGSNEYRKCDDYLVKFCYSRTHLKIRTMRLPTTSDPSVSREKKLDSWVSIRLTPFSECQSIWAGQCNWLAGSDSISFDPVSGRLAFVDSKDNVLHIWDFLPA